MEKRSCGNSGAGAELEQGWSVVSVDLLLDQGERGVV